jgi:hypothetical protein
MFLQFREEVLSQVETSLGRMVVQDSETKATDLRSHCVRLRISVLEEICPVSGRNIQIRPPVSAAFHHW